MKINETGTPVFPLGKNPQGKCHKMQIQEEYATVQDVKYLLDEIDSLFEQLADIEARDDGHG